MNEPTYTASADRRTHRIDPSLLAAAASCRRRGGVPRTKTIINRPGSPPTSAEMCIMARVGRREEKRKELASGRGAKGREGVWANMSPSAL